jgi:UDP-galactopyranose mutase
MPLRRRRIDRTVGGPVVTDVLVVGMGFAGITAARVLAESGFAVHLIDQRPHIGGNAFDTVDQHGVLVHPYGPHVFHTNSELVFRYLSRFTAWRAYEHRVLASVDGKLLPIPINRTTINHLYGLDLDEREVGDFLARSRERRAPLATSEDVVLDRVGPDLCAKFFRGYTRKHWGLDLSELSPSVAGRIPVRTGDDDRYFTDTYQAMPAAGYTEMFLTMLAHERITYATGVDFASIRGRLACRHVIFTGSIDAYFDHCYGRLCYRSVQFEHEHLPVCRWYQPVGTVNFPNEFDYTRVTEFKHLTGQSHPGTSIVREYPCADGEPFYPIPRPQNEALYRRYAVRAARCRDVTFIGRLARYRYYNMDQAVGAALAAARRLIPRLSTD